MKQAAVQRFAAADQRRKDRGEIAKHLSMDYVFDPDAAAQAEIDRRLIEIANGLRSARLGVIGSYE